MEETPGKKINFADKTPEELHQFAAEARERAKLARISAAAHREKIAEKVEPVSEPTDIEKRMAEVRARIAGFKKDK